MMFMLPLFPRVDQNIIYEYNHKLDKELLKTLFIRSIDTAGILANPNSMAKNANKSYLVTKVVLGSMDSQTLN